MALVKFRFSRLGDIDGGRIEEALEQCLQRLIADCEDRPAVAKARTLSFKMTMVPTMDDAGDLDTIKVTFSADDKLPGRSTRDYQMAVRRVNGKHTLLFQDLAPDNPSQMTIEDAIEAHASPSID